MTRSRAGRVQRRQRRCALAGAPAHDEHPVPTRELRFESAAYRWFELGNPFRIGFDQAGLRGVHIIVRGDCELVFPDGPPNRSRPGTS